MTTLADILVARSLVMEPGHDGAQIIRQEMADCVRFVIREEVDEIALQIMREIPRAEIPWPMPPLEQTWLEITVRHAGMRVRIGVMLRTSGIGFLVLTDETRWQLGPFSHDLEKQEVTLGVAPQEGEMFTRPMIGEIMDRMLLIFHMIQQPRIVEKRLVVHDDRLQRSRARAGKPPLVHFHEVTVHVTRRERAAAAAAADVERRTGKRLHHVRAFYRVRLGRIERVCAHWRGCADLGVSIATGHRVAR